MSKAKLRKTMSENDTCVLPYDILFDVLIKLPVPSLLRFKSVSKSWNAIISDKNMFAKAQRDQSKALGREKIVLQRTTGEFEFIHLENPRGIVEKQNFPIKGFQRAHVICSCDGLVLLKKSKAYKKFVLWNPSSRQYRTIECPYRKPHDYKLPHACGLCYHSTTDDYKVVLIYSLYYTIYSMSRDSWSTIKENLPILVQHLPSFGLRPNSRFFLCFGGINIEGRVYWSLNHKIDHYVHKTSTIIYFDVKSDELKELPIPNFVRDENGLFLLSTLKGCLCLYGRKRVAHELGIWIMEQDGWKWLMRCKMPTTYFIGCYKLLCCTKNGELIFDGPGHDRDLSIYDPKRQRFVTTTYISNHLEYGLRDVTPTCLDSLYFPSNNVVHKRKKLNHIY